MLSDNFKIYNHIFMLDNVLDNGISEKEFKKLFKKSRAWIGRLIKDFDVDHQTEWWHCIKSEKFDLNDVNSNVRRKIRRAQEKFEVSFADENIDLTDLFAVLLAAKIKYTNCDLKTELGSFENEMNGFLKNENCDVIVVREKETGKIVGYAVVSLHEKYVDTSIIKFDPAYLKYYLSYALFVFIMDYYIAVKQYKFITDGERTIRHTSNLQEFLYDNFKFRKAYCEIYVLFKWWVKVLLLISLPFSKIIGKMAVKSVAANKLNSVLVLYKINRSEIKKKKQNG